MFELKGPFFFDPDSKHYTHSDSMSRIVADMYFKYLIKGPMKDTWRGSSIGAAKDGQSTISIGTPEGTNRNFLVEVKITELDEDCNDEYWQLMIKSDAKRPNEVVVINNIHYVIGEEHSRYRNHPSVRGYGGRKFVIKFFDGRVVATTNLWHQGPIPPKYREHYPNNAEFDPSGVVVSE